MKNIDVLDGKIEEVRNGNDPCSTVKYDKPNGILDSKLTKNGKVLEDRDSVMNERGKKLLSTEISRDKDGASAVEKNKDGGHDSANSDKLTARATASPVNRPDDSSSCCSNNGLPSRQDISSHVSKEAQVTKMKEFANESNSNDESEKNQQSLPSPKLSIRDTKEVENKNIEEIEPEASNETNFNDESGKNHITLSSPKPHEPDTKDIEEKNLQDVEPETETSNGPSKIINDAPIMTNAESATSKVEGNSELGVQKIQESEKINFVNSASKLDGESKLRPDVEVETVTFFKKRDEQKVDSNQQSEDVSYESNDCEKSIALKNSDDSEEKKIEVSVDKSSLEAVSEPVDNTVLKADESKNEEIEASGDKSEEEDESTEKLQEFVEKISTADNSMEIEESSLKSDEKEASSVMDSISLEDALEEKVENTLLQSNTSDKDGGEKVDDGEGETHVTKTDEMELKKIDEPSMKTDEIVDAADKTDIQGESINVTEKSDSQDSNNESEERYQEKTLTENVAPMEVDEDGNCDEVEKNEIGGSNEIAAKKDSEQQLQDSEKGSAVTSEASDGVDILKQPSKSSEQSDVSEESTTPTEGLQVGQKRPAEFEEDNLKRFKTDDSVTAEEGLLKKRGFLSLEDIISESKRKRTEPGDYEDKNSSENSKSNANSDSSEPEQSTNVDNSDIELEKCTQLDLDDNCETDVDLDLELKSSSSESSVSDAAEAECMNKNELLKKLLGSDSDNSNSGNKGSSSSEKSTKVKYDGDREKINSESASLITEEESSNALIKETLRRLKKSDLENLVMLKMSENLSYKIELGELRKKYKTAKESIDRWMRRCHYFEKIESELSMTLKRYLDVIDTYKNEKGPEYILNTPMKFTRSVGLQVAGPLNHKASRHPGIRSIQPQKTKQEEEHEQFMQQKYKQQQQLHEEQQKKQQQIHEQQKQQQQKEQQQKALMIQENIQAVNSVKPAAPKVTSYVRSSQPRRMVSSKPASAVSTSLAQEVNNTRIVMASSSNLKSPPRLAATAAATGVAAAAAAAPASSTTTAAVSPPVPVAITASKMARTATPKSHEVIDLTDKDEKSRTTIQDSQNPPSTASYTVVRQILPAGKQVVPKTANGQRAYLVPTLAVQGNTRQLLIATTTGLTQLPLGTTVVSSAGRNNAVTLAANGTVVVKNGAVSNVMNIQRPVQAIRVTQSATHPAPLPPCPPAIHQSGWLLAPPRPQLVVRKTPNGAGIMLSWTLALNKGFEDIASYQLYAYQESTAPPSSTLWKKVGDVKALPLPMACTLTQFVEGHKYHFAVRAVDIHSRVGHFSGPSTITLN